MKEECFYLKEARTNAWLYGHDIITSGHLLISLYYNIKEVQDFFYHNFSISSTTLYSEFFNIFPNNICDTSKDNVEMSSLPISPACADFNRYIKEMCLDECSWQVMLYQLLARPNTITAHTLLKKLGVDYKDVLKQVSSPSLGRKSGCRKFYYEEKDKNMNYQEFPYTAKYTIFKAVSEMRKIARELPKLRRLEAVQHLFTNNLSKEAEEVYMKMRQNTAERELEMISNLADDLSRLSNITDINMTEVRGVGNTKDVNNYELTKNFVDYYSKVSGVPKNDPHAEDKTCENSLDADNPPPTHFLKNGLYVGNQICDDTGIQPAVGTLYFLKDENREAIFTGSVWKDATCPQDHHKLEGECRYDYCRCSCTRCKIQCEKHGR